MKVLTRYAGQTSSLGHMLGEAQVRMEGLSADRPPREQDFCLMINRLCGELGLMLEKPATDTDCPAVVAEFWKHVADLKEFFGIKSGISQLVSMLRTACYCFLFRETPREALVEMAKCLRTIANELNYTDDFADEIGDRLEAAGVDLNAMDGLKKFPGE